MRVVIPLSDASSDELRRLASREYRDLRMQAKLLLERAIHEHAGALPAESSHPVVPPKIDQSQRSELADAGIAR